MAKWHGAAATLLARLDRRADPQPPLSREWSPFTPISIPSPLDEHVVEVSPLESFDTAAGHFPSESEVMLPAEIWRGFRGAGLFVRVVAIPSGREIVRGRLMKSK